MKLKEKLAKKSGDKFWDKFQRNGEEFVMHPNVLYSLIYIEGFERAREMAREMIYKQTVDDCGTGYDTPINPDAILELGEKEV